MNPAGGTADRVAATVHGMAGRVRSSGWPVLQAALAAGVAWALAMVSIHQQQAFFAPISAIVVLLGGVGARAGRARHVVVGVTLGVVVGELVALTAGPGPVSVALAAGVAMLAMSLFYTDTLPLIQSGVGAVLVVVMHTPTTSTGRLLAALLGAAIAVLFTQVLFTPSPTRMLSDATGAVLRACADTLRAAADALRRAEQAGAPGDADDSADPGGTPGEELLEALNSLGPGRRSALFVGRWSVRGRREGADLEELAARAARLPALVADVLVVRRAAATGRLRPGEAAAVDALADAARQLAGDPCSTSRRAAARGVASGWAGDPAPGPLCTVAEGLALVAAGDRSGRPG